MKKIFSIFFAGVIALLATACYPEDELATFNSSTAKAPVVGGYEMGKKALTVEYTPGSFNMGFNDKMPVNHKLLIVTADGKNVEKAVTTSNKDNVLTASVTALSNALISLGYQEDQTANFEMIIRATMQNAAQDNGRNGYVDSKDKIVVSNFVVTFPKGSPYMEYTATSPWSVIGSIADYEMSWNKDLEMWMTEDGNQHVAKCVSLKAGDEFKFRKDLSWGENMGGDFGSLDTPFGVSQDGPNIKAPADGLYDLWLDLGAGTAMLTEAYQAYPDHKEASNWTVIGSLSEYGISWDNDLAMVTDGTTSIAQGVKLAAGDEFKFRQDKSWDVNLGGDFGGLGNDFGVSQDGPNIKVGEAGVFDLIVNPGAGTAQIVETMGGGKSGIIGGNEPGPEPEPITGWNIIGLNGDWENDIIAAPSQDNNTWTAYVTANEDTEFKWRKDGGWDENMGMETGATITIGEPFGIEPDGPNVPLAAGFWKIVLDLGQGTMTIFPGDVWSLIGDFNGWAGDVDMVLTDGKWVSPATHLNENGFKIRHNHDWAESIGGNFVDFKVPFEAISADGPNIVLPAAGDYIVTYDPEAQTIVVEKSISGWNVIGLNGNWNDDVLAKENNNVWTVRVNVAEATEFKWRKDGGWDENYGGDFVELGVPFAAVAGGNNIKLNPGFWLLTLDLSGDAPMLMVSEGTVWSLIGVNGDWSNDIDMTLIDGVWVSPETAMAADSEFKIRKDYSWDENRGGDMESLGVPFDAVAGGNNIKIASEGMYVVTYDPAAEKITVSNAKKVWSVIGDFTGWSADVDMEEVAPGIWVSDMVEIADGGWKVRFDHGWDNNRGGATPEAAGQFVGAVPGGDNIGLHGKFKVVYNANNETLGTLVWGVVGSIASLDFNWNKDLPMNLGSDGKWYSSPVFITKDDQFKIRKDADWAENFGGTMTAVEEAFDAVAGGDNIKVAEDGTYMVVYDPTAGKLTISKLFWALIGEFNSWSGDLFMMYNGAAWVAYNQSIAGEWKIRQACGWDVNRGGDFVEANTAFDAVAGGNNIKVGDLTGWAVVYDPAAEKITIVK